MKTATHQRPRYLIKIWYEEPDKCYIAEVPDLPGCMTYGDSYTQAAARIQDAIELWLDMAKAHHDPIPEPHMVAEEIAHFGPVLNVAKLARQAGLNQHTVASKLRRKTPFSDLEAKALRAVLSEVKFPKPDGRRARRTPSTTPA